MTLIFSSESWIRFSSKAKLILCRCFGTCRQQNMHTAAHILSIYAKPDQLFHRYVQAQLFTADILFFSVLVHSLLVLPLVPGSSGTSSTSGSGHCQNISTSLSQATGPAPLVSLSQKGKGTFTDDLHQLVDNWARDAINLSQCKRGPKTGAQTTLGHDVCI